MFVDTDEIGIDMIAEHLNVEKPITKDNCWKKKGYSCR